MHATIHFVIDLTIKAFSDYPENPLVARNIARSRVFSPSEKGNSRSFD